MEVIVQIYTTWAGDHGECSSEDSGKKGREEEEAEGEAETNEEAQGRRTHSGGRRRQNTKISRVVCRSRDLAAPERE